MRRARRSETVPAKATSLVLLRIAQCLILMLPLLSAAELYADDQHPLEPVDTSSPRATLNSFMDNMHATWTLVSGEYWHSPNLKLFTQGIGLAGRALRTLDLSQTSPTTRVEVGYDGATFLYEVLLRLPLPPQQDIPGVAALTSPDQPTHWTLPHTEITIARVMEGPHKGEFLFTPETVARAEEFYLKTRHLSYRGPVPLQDAAKLREFMPGWMIPIATIERLPAWTKNIVLGQAVWKWCAFALLLLILIAIIVAVHKFVRRYHSDKAVYNYLHQLTVPLIIILLMHPTAYLLTEQINFISNAARAVNLVTGVIVYLLSTWVAWLGSLLIAELVILSPKIGEDSLDAQLLRLSARIVGIILGIVLIFYGANQIGIPLVGVLAGVGVGGLAIALAAQDSLKNLLGSLMIFMDQPYKPGERIVVQGHDGFVEQIGLRSTKIRLLDGALTSIPNEKMASLDIENIGRRKFIRRQTNLRLAYATPAEKIEQALVVVKEILKDHEGMQTELPPRVFFDKFNPDSLNIFISYWYHPPKRWKAMQFDERINMEILQRLNAEGIRLVPPASAMRVSLENSGATLEGQLSQVPSE